MPPGLNVSPESVKDDAPLRVSLNPAWDEAINITSDPIFLVDGDYLQRAFADAVREASDFDRARREAGKSTILTPLLDQVLEELLNNVTLLDREAIGKIFKFFEDYSGPRKSREGLQRAQAALMIEGVPISYLVAVNRWLKFVFYRLWTRKVFLFPMNFYANTSFSKAELREILPLVATCHLDNPKADFASIGLRLTLASTWWDFDRIDLDCWGSFTVAVAGSKALRQKWGFGAKHPTYFLTAVLKSWRKAGEGKGLRYTASEIDGYLYWVKQIRRGMPYIEPTKFIPNVKEHQANLPKMRRDRFKISEGQRRPTCSTITQRRSFGLTS
jgi:hypothetical protein